MKQPLRQYRKPVVTGLLLSLVLFLNALAACSALHKWFHQDADNPSHECAVTLFAHGKVDSVSVDIPVVFSSVPVESVPQVQISVLSATAECLPPGRAPPAIHPVS